MEMDFIAIYNSKQCYSKASRILEHSSNPALCGFSMMEQVRLCAVWSMENWLGSSLNQIQGWTTVREYYNYNFRARTSDYKARVDNLSLIARVDC